MLDDSLKTQLNQLLVNVTQPIELVASYGEGSKAGELRELLADIAAQSDKVTVREGADRRSPSFAIVRVGAPDVSVRFAGIPMGHEFTSLVLALLWVGGHPMKIADDLQEQIKGLEGDFEFTTYMSLSCQNCPDVVQALNMMSVLNPRIRHTAVDGALYQEEVTRHDIKAVPNVFLNGEPFESGRMTVEQIISKIDPEAGQRKAATLAGKDPFDVLVVGGGPAGATAAIYAARKGIRTGMAVDRFGGQVQDTVGIENFVSVPYTEGPKLAAQLEQHVGEYDVDVMHLQVAEHLKMGTDGLVEVDLVSGATLKSKTVVLSTGASWRQLGVPGEKEYRNKGVTYCPHCDGPFFKGKKVAVIGGGNSGVEAAIDLAGIVEHVTLIEFMDKLLADQVLVDKFKSMPNTDIVLNAQTSELAGDGKALQKLVYVDRVSGESRKVEVEGVFVQIGLVPNTGWLAGSGVELTKRGEIVVDQRGATSLPGVFAAGDCTTIPYKQIVTAMGSGATAALSAFDHLIRSSVPVSA